MNQLIFRKHIEKKAFSGFEHCFLYFSLRTLVWVCYL